MSPLTNTKHNKLRELKKARQICFFGIGALLEECYQQLVLLLGREPDVLCDNSNDKWGRKFYKRNCISITQLGQLHPDTTILITIRNYESIHEQLRKMNFTNIFICSFNRCYNVVQNIISPEAEPNHEPAKVVSVKGKWTFITGAARGIGRQIAIEMAHLGSNIIGLSRSIDHTKEVEEICCHLGVSFVPVAAELSNLPEFEAMLDQLEQLAPQIDFVFNNAGISPPCPDGFWTSRHHDYVSSYLVNTVVPIRICQHLIPPMRQRGFGRVINITSSIQKRPAEMAYACSKAALNKFVHDLSPSLDGTGVMITLLDPGWLRTDMGGDSAPHPIESVIPAGITRSLFTI